MTQLRSREQAAAERAAQIRQVTNRPSDRRDAPGGNRGTTAPQNARLRVTRAAATPDAPAAPVVLEGYACVTERAYDMWDGWGPYTEIVSQGAFGATLLAQPDVKLLFNHRGMPMARTVGGTLTLSEDSTGLLMRAEPVMGLPITQEVLSGIDAQLLDEMSFAFTITRGHWSPDYMEFRIEEVDINRGDVSVVTYGANPHTSVDARSTTEPATAGLSVARRQMDLDAMALRLRSA